MRAESTRGSSTLEVLVAFGVLALALTAAVPIALGGRGLLADAGARTDALALSGRALELARAAASEDFQSLQSTSSTDGVYASTLEVLPVDLWTERVVSAVSWRSAGGRIGTVKLSSLFVNPDPESTCRLVPGDGWRQPQADAFSLADLVGAATGTYAVTDVDAWNGRLYVTASGSSTKQATFFVFDVRDPAQPTLLGQIDNDAGAKTGPNAVAVAPSGGRVYAYLANASSFTRGQLQVVDVTDPATNGWAPQVITYKIPTSVAPTAGLGNSIFYRRGYAYLGLTSAPGGQEFGIVDVHDPARPAWLGGYSLQGHAVGAIFIQGGYAYLAHPAGSSGVAKEQLTVLDVTDPREPRRVSGFYALEGLGGNGKSLAAANGRIYLGRTTTKISGPTDALPEFLALDNHDPTAPPTALGSLNLATAESVNGLVVRGNLGFLLTSNHLQAWDLTDVAAPRPFTPNASASEFPTLPGKGVSLDCEGDALYVGGTTDDGRGFLEIITPRT